MCGWVSRQVLRCARQGAAATTRTQHQQASDGVALVRHVCTHVCKHVHTQFYTHVDTQVCNGMGLVRHPHPHGRKSVCVRHVCRHCSGRYLSSQRTRRRASPCSTSQKSSLPGIPSHAVTARYTQPCCHCQVYPAMLSLPGTPSHAVTARYTQPPSHAVTARYTQPCCDCQVYPAMLSLPGIPSHAVTARYTQPCCHCQVYPAML